MANRFQQTMRWFGPHDIVSLSDIRQAGCSGVVTALHHIPVGEIWPVEEINKRKKIIEDAGLRWTVIESLPVSEDIKKQTGHYLQHIEHYKTSLINLAQCGLEVVTYNFMPILDWLRTNISYELPDGSRALYFNRLSFIAFDAYLLQRPAASQSYTAAELEQARLHLDALNEEAKKQLFKNCLLGLPGSDIPFTAEEVLAALKTYANIDARLLKKHLAYFLQEVVPVAEKLGLKMAIHPDDPPYPMLGLPRIVSTATDLSDLLSFAPSPSNGLCFCTGSLGVRADNDLVKMINQFGEKIHFVHLRSTKRDGEGNFFEADHLDGDVDMYAVVKALFEQMQKQQTDIPMRPDHGHQMLDDLKKTTYPGYSAIGRLRGLAEIRGLELAISRQ